MSSALKVLIIDPDYPRQANLYGDVFVHTRLKAYPADWEINVIGYNPLLSERCEYIWDGINVMLSPALAEIESKIRDSSADVLIVHFVQHELMTSLLSKGRPILIFCHGFESTSWKRRLLNYSRPGDLQYLIRYIRNNRIQLGALKKFIVASNKRNDIHFVFVSQWLQQACESDLGVDISNKHVIHNAIDTSRFSFVKKDPSLRKRILAIRSFGARNYANDILVDAILHLSKKNYFNELSFSIYGEGYLFKELTDKIKHFKNVHLHNHFVTNDTIPALHKEHGTFFCFSRLDSQGVSMCEAMSSGLTTFTSNVAAIPEFVTNGDSGFVTKGMKDILRSMDVIMESPEAFIKISEKGSERIAEKCGLSVIIPQETNLILQLANL